MAKKTLLWHDYETWGVNPRKDRASQFAAIRTNLALEEIDDPVMLYCHPTDDFLPHPEAALITGQTPQQVSLNGMNEADFFQKINAEFSKTGTCGVGYNSIRFDDEISRFGFYRNFIDPYAREWQNGNSRWDIIDLLRMTHALRPDGIEWAKREDGTPSFRLEDLCKANHIAHEDAHDALADVRATLALARLIKQQQPKLYDFYFNFRKKNNVKPYLNILSKKVILHITGMYPASQGCITPVVPLLQSPSNQNQMVVYDLRQDPTQLLTMSPEEMAENLYSKKEDLPEGVQRIGLKGVHLNKSPALAPINTLNDELTAKWHINWQQIQQNYQQLFSDPSLNYRLNQLYQRLPEQKDIDADHALYSGGFIKPNDRKICNKLLQKTPRQLKSWKPPFRDARLKTLYWRYRARNYPKTLSTAEKKRWQKFCKERLQYGKHGCTLTLAKYQQIIEQCAQQQNTSHENYVLNQLIEWVL